MSIWWTMDGVGSGRAEGTGFRPGHQREADVWTAPGAGGPDPAPEREWGLSAWQVVAVVLVIVAVSELIGVLS